jgi:hypothetical protein
VDGHKNIKSGWEEAVKWIKLMPDKVQLHTPKFVVEGFDNGLFFPYLS